jgi:sugar lactone lactonase YvrE
MSSFRPHPALDRVEPPRVVDGGQITLHGRDLPVDPFPRVTIGGVAARVESASPRRIVVYAPAELEGGRMPVQISGVPDGPASFVQVGSQWATGLHQVDNPVFDAFGNLYVTYSGPRGQEAPVSIFRVTRAGTREAFASGIVNATSMAFGPDGALYVSSRFEGAVYRVADDGTYEAVATDLGVASGIAFDGDGLMYVGDRSGTVFRVATGKATAFAMLPASIAAFHLAFGPDGTLFVSAPTLGSYDHIYRIARDGTVTRLRTPFGRPQGLAMAPDGCLHVVEALAGSSGVHRIANEESRPEQVVSGGALVGLAFGVAGELVVVSNETAYKFE